MALTPGQKEDLRTQLNRIIVKTITGTQLNDICRSVEVNTQDPIPEQLLTCSRCGKTIIAYWVNGEAFITENTGLGVKYYHNDLSKCIA